MAQALTGYKAYGIRHDGETRSHAYQVVEMYITAANTDVTYDIGTAAGTFWTSALADATYGVVAASALNFILTTLPGTVVRLLRPEAEALTNRIQVLTSPSTSQYSILIASAMPTITFSSGTAPVAMYLTLTWMLHDGIEPRAQDYGIAI